MCKGCKYEHICITDLKGSIGNFIENKSILESVRDYSNAKIERDKYKSAEKNYDKALATLKELFPLEEKLYMSENYLIQTKINKRKDTQYLSFDVMKIFQDAGFKLNELIIKEDVENISLDKLVNAIQNK